MPDFIQEDFSSPTWLRMKAYGEKRLEELRRKNDTPLEPRETAKLRGRIAEMKRILALADNKPLPMETDDA